MQTPWWQATTVYQIYPRSFFDANGDGIGDLEGILRKLDYLAGLGVETLWLSPFFASPQQDFGYDICGHYAIAPEYGTLEDCARLIEEVHAREMKVVFDLVLNHTSDAHPWFVASRSARDNPKRDWYIWRDGQKPDGKAPPNNWRAMIGGSGWQYDAHTQQWYWATFLPFQPDLNYRNPAVKAAMFAVMRHWLEAGVDGFRLDIFNAIFKDASFADNPFSWRPLPAEDNPDGFFQRNEHTINHPDTLAFAREVRALMNEYDDPPRFLVGEVFGSTEVLQQYCGDDADGLHLVFLFKTLHTPFAAQAFRKVIQEFEAAFRAPLCPTYVFGNHDRPRRTGTIAQEDPRKAKLLATFQLTVRGVPFLYYGEEIGMPPVPLSHKTALDPMGRRYKWVPEFVARWLSRKGILLNRDECRAPMQWDTTAHGGFCPSTAKPWLPLSTNASTCNVAQQEAQPDSLLETYRALLQLRKQTPALHQGKLTLLEELEPQGDLLGYRRSIEAQTHDETGPATSESIEVLLNFGARQVALPSRFQQGYTTLFSSLRPTLVHPKDDPPSPAPATLSHLLPYEGLILRKTPEESPR